MNDNQSSLLNSENSQGPTIQQLCDSMKEAVPPYYLSNYGLVFQALMKNKSWTENQKRTKALRLIVQIAAKYKELRNSDKALYEVRKLLPIYINDTQTPGRYEMLKVFLPNTLKLNLTEIYEKIEKTNEKVNENTNELWEKAEKYKLIFDEEVMNNMLTLNTKSPNSKGYRKVPVSEANQLSTDIIDEVEDPYIVVTNAPRGTDMSTVPVAHIKPAQQ